MIGEFENTAPLTGFPVKNEVKFSEMRSLFLSLPDFSFTDVDDFEDQDSWIQAEKDENIFQILGILQAEDNSEETLYVTSELDIEYFVKHGKHKIKFMAPYNEEYHYQISGWSGQDMRVFMADINKNAYGTLDGSEVRGFDVELFHVEQKKLSFGTNPAWTVIYVVLSTPVELTVNGQISALDWNINTANLIHVTLSSISGDNNYVEFTVKDSVYGISIEGLNFDEITITDDTGGISMTILTELGCGQYKATCSGALSTGDILIDSNWYYGTGEYIISETEATFSNFVFESTTKFQVDVDLSASGDPVTGALIGDFTISESAISSVNEVSTGRYEFVTSEALDTGTIEIDTGTITGSNSYDVIIEVEFVNILVHGDYQTWVIQFDLQTVVSGDPVTGMTMDKFSIDDNYNGEADAFQLTESPAGTYVVGFEKARTIGEITLTDDLYFGTDSYDLQESSFVNMGGSDTTDLVDTDTDGAADRLTEYANIDYDIITGDTYFGRYQKITRTASSASATVTDLLCSYFKYDVQYQLRITYRTANTGTSSDKYVNVIFFGYETGTSYHIIDFDLSPSGPSPSVVYTSDPFYMNDLIYAELIFNFSRVNMILSIDKIELIEV